jgi:two-component system, cell cycle sensor histidine kinase and response regulator CckA
MGNRNSRVMIVEDEAIVAMDLQLRVEALGHTVVGTAASAASALRQVAETRPDVTLMDIRLRGDVDGIAVAEQIRRNWDLPVVFLTAFTDTSTVARATATEPFGYIAKPVHDRELDIAIDVALHRHDAEKRVKRMERWLATTLSSIGDAVIATDQNGCVTFMNPVAQRLTGWEFGTAAGLHIDEVMPLIDEEQSSSIESPVRRVLSEGVVLGFAQRTLLVRRSGERMPIDDSASPIRSKNEGVTGVVFVFRDVTQERRIAEEVRQSQKLEAVGRLAGGVAHEYNNLMTIVLGFSEMLLASELMPESLRSHATNISHAATRAGTLTRQLLTFGRKQVSQPVPMDLNIAIAEINQMLTCVVGEQVRLEMDLAAGEATIEADRGEIEQMIINLAANARDAMPAGGTLTIATSCEGSSVVIRASDTGTGMTPEVKEHLFEPFFTTKEPGRVPDWASLPCTEPLRSRAVISPWTARQGWERHSPYVSL